MTNLWIPTPLVSSSSGSPCFFQREPETCMRGSVGTSPEKFLWVPLSSYRNGNIFWDIEKRIPFWWVCFPLEQPAQSLIGHYQQKTLEVQNRGKGPPTLKADAVSIVGIMSISVCNILTAPLMGCVQGNKRKLTFCELPSHLAFKR